MSEFVAGNKVVRVKCDMNNHVSKQFKDVLQKLRKCDKIAMTVKKMKSDKNSILEEVLLTHKMISRDDQKNLILTPSGKALYEGLKLLGMNEFEEKKEKKLLGQRVLFSCVLDSKLDELGSKTYDEESVLKKLYVAKVEKLDEMVKKKQIKSTAQSYTFISNTSRAQNLMIRANALNDFRYESLKCKGDDEPVVRQHSKDLVEAYENTNETGKVISLRNGNKFVYLRDIDVMQCESCKLPMNLKKVMKLGSQWESFVLMKCERVLSSHPMTICGFHCHLQANVVRANIIDEPMMK